MIIIHSKIKCVAYFIETPPCLVNMHLAIDTYKHLKSMKVIKQISY